MLNYLNRFFYLKIIVNNTILCIFSINKNSVIYLIKFFNNNIICIIVLIVIFIYNF